MKDILFGAVLFTLTGLMLFAVISEWGTLLTLMIGVAFVLAAAAWLLWGGATPEAVTGNSARILQDLPALGCGCE